jgi:hypothetical protein
MLKDGGRGLGGAGTRRATRSHGGTLRSEWSTIILIMGRILRISQVYKSQARHNYKQMLPMCEQSHAGKKLGFDSDDS